MPITNAKGHYHVKMIALVDFPHNRGTFERDVFAHDNDPLHLLWA